MDRDISRWKKWFTGFINQQEVSRLAISKKHALLISIWRFLSEQENPHQAPSPLALSVRVIYSVMDERKGIVIDPYCGSGTTLVAAKILGHDFVGIEISGEVIKFAEDRLKNFESELKFAQEGGLQTYCNKDLIKRENRKGNLQEGIDSKTSKIILNK